MIHILMIEDDEDLAQILTEYLAQFNMTIYNYPDPFLGLSALEMRAYDLVILDLSLPGLDGLELCRKINERSDIPIIISSARSDVADKVIGLEQGADDYLPKPYDPRELVARIKSVLRRGEKHPEPEPANGDFAHQIASRTILFKDHPLDLTPGEYGILAYLVDHANQAVSREDLIYHVEALDEESTTKSIDVMIGRIRHKLGDNPKKPRYIHAVRGLGYRLLP